MLTAPKKQGAYNIYVKDLLLLNVKQWNMRVLREMFDCAAVEDIIQVFLVEDVTEDRLVWREEQNGHYRVRLGYRNWKISKKRHFDELEKDNWNSLWSIKAPSRVKHLL